MAQATANLIWKIADLLRGPISPTDAAVILPFTILGRLDSILAPTQDEPTPAVRVHSRRFASAMPVISGVR